MLRMSFRNLRFSRCLFCSSVSLSEHMSPWKRYDTISYINEESIEHVLSKLNGYHDNIEFT